jgi:hypothetical protein
MVALGKAAIIESLRRLGGDLRAARDDLRAAQRGRLATRLARANDELELVCGVLEGRDPEPADLAMEVAGDLAERAQMYAARELENELAGKPRILQAPTARDLVARGFLHGYAACVDDGKSAATASGRARRGGRAGRK